MWALVGDTVGVGLGARLWGEQVGRRMERSIVERLSLFRSPFSVGEYALDHVCFIE